MQSQSPITIQTNELGETHASFSKYTISGSLGLMHWSKSELAYVSNYIDAITRSSYRNGGVQQIQRVALNLASIRMKMFL